MTTNNLKTIKFDPGYAPIALDSLGQVGYNYYIFSAISDIKLKRMKFQSLAQKMERHLKINISFYLGCLLWASYISQFEDYEIEGNQLLNETCEESEYTGEIDFLIDFIENKYPRDYKYFANNTYSADNRFIPILKAYREFLVINKGFVNCSNTGQVKMPDSLKKIDKNQLDNVNSKIQEAIKEKNLEMLFDCYDLLF